MNIDWTTFSINKMDEGIARFTFNAACGLSAAGAAASIFLGLRLNEVGATVFLFIAIILCAVSITAYRRYSALRDIRWKLELKSSEDELNQVLNHARMNIIISHATGPLHEQTPSSAAKESPEEQPFARR